VVGGASRGGEGGGCFAEARLDTSWTTLGRTEDCYAKLRVSGVRGGLLWGVKVPQLQIRERLRLPGPLEPGGRGGGPVYQDAQGV